jgi:hypothetical protein
MTDEICEHCEKCNEEITYWRREFLGNKIPLNKQGQIIEAAFMFVPTDTMMKNGPMKNYIEIVKATLRDDENRAD